MSDIAIEISELNKTFRVYPDLSRSRIKQAIFPWRHYYREKIALEDINLSVGKGEVIGVLGPNGAGKTTLLKLIAGISRPTSGRLSVNGRVVTVLALGMGFHPRLSGNENILLAGLLLGMSKREINEKRNWIIDFAELSEYIDQPLTTYSTGMKARLSFAVAACQNPEILIIDEALATGDIRFVQKCINRIQEIVKSGTTALFVSHNIWSIKRLTSRSILLNGGRLVADGETHRVADQYYEAMLNCENIEQLGSSLKGKSFVGTGEVALKAVSLLDESGALVRHLHSGEGARVVLDVESDRARDNVSIALQCHRVDGIPAFACGALAGGAIDEAGNFNSVEFNLSPGANRIVVEYPRLLLAPGEFYFDLQIFDARDFSGYVSGEQFFFKSHILDFTMQQFRNPNFFNLYHQPARIFVEQSEK